MKEEKLKYAVRIIHRGEAIAIYVIRDERALPCITDIWRKYVMPDRDLILKIDTIEDKDEENDQEWKDAIYFIESMKEQVEAG